MPDAAALTGRGRAAGEALAVSAGLVLLALAAHQGWPWVIAGAGGLAVAAVAAERSLRGAVCPARMLGLAPFSWKAVAFIPAGLVLGAGLAVAYRLWQGTAALPSGLQAFAAVACLIGATEELVYRGYVQGRLHVLGRPAAVVLAACAHAAYKTALFALPPAPMEFNYSFILIATVIGGVAFGLLRECSGSVVPPVLAHAAFDLVVYGAVAEAPWWVWT